MKLEVIHMEETHVNTRQPAKRVFNWAILLSLPLFFLLGWVANDTLMQNSQYRAEPGVGGAPFIDEASPTPKVKPTVTEEPTVTITPKKSATPTDKPVRKTDDDDDVPSDN